MKTTISKSNYKIQAKKKKNNKKPPTETESTMRSFNVTLLWRVNHTGSHCWGARDAKKHMTFGLTLV